LQTTGDAASKPERISACNCVCLQREFVQVPVGLH